MSAPFVGEIRAFGGNFAPQGWFMCDGSLLPIDQYQVLFALIGTTYGGNGQTNFALPDLRGRSAIHQGQGGGLSNYVIGQQLGAETVTLLTAQMGAHNHTFGATNTAGTAANPGAAAILAATPSGLPIYDGQGSAVSLAPNATTTAGASQPHDNRQPYLAITYIIAWEGIFPSQN
jgi:microcystin-dependent protein